MRDTTLMQQALGLASPWTVVRSDFDTAAGRLDVEIDFTPGSRFACPTCGAADCPAYDTQRKTWRHLNVFQHQAYLNPSSGYSNGFAVGTLASLAHTWLAGLSPHRAADMGRS